MAVKLIPVDKLPPRKTRAYEWKDAVNKFVESDHSIIEIYDPNGRPTSIVYHGLIGAVRKSGRRDIKVSTKNGGVFLIRAKSEDKNDGGENQMDKVGS